jgi:hypothetical protein
MSYIDLNRLFTRFDNPLVSLDDCLGSIHATGLSLTRTSQTLTRPSREPVTISGAPLPIPRPPTPSMQLIMEL